MIMPKRENPLRNNNNQLWVQHGKLGIRPFKSKDYEAQAPSQVRIFLFFFILLLYILLFAHFKKISLLYETENSNYGLRWQQ